MRDRVCVCAFERVCVLDVVHMTTECFENNVFPLGSQKDSMFFPLRSQKDSRFFPLRSQKDLCPHDNIFIPIHTEMQVVLKSHFLQNHAASYSLKLNKIIIKAMTLRDEINPNPA